ncbi:MAG: bifunctional oligoribonuclease/PAP phosphatase NrnA [Candidatus Schekmanbacteria bacterium]|nr:MAG: bifunctional oligoribonuclease/PAP phosphatase NrnA [Candidatus Schekmanbacteria bacterium]
MSSLLLIGTSNFLVSLVNGLKSERRKVVVFCPSKKIKKKIIQKGYDVIEGDPFVQANYSKIDLNDATEIIVTGKNIKKLKPLLSYLNEKKKQSAQLILALEESDISEEEKREIKANKIISLSDLISKDFYIELGKYNKRRNIERLLSTINEGDNVLILTHDNPDPDSIASAHALEYFLKKARKVKTTIAYGGEVGRAENLNMIDILNIKMKPLRDVKVEKFNKIAMVETYPGGNNSFDENITPSIVIDHHPQKKKYSAAFIDLRTDIGANSSILAEYFIHSRYKMNKRVATALLYAIKTDTMSLNRGSTPSDIEAFSYLYTQADINLLKKIEQPSLTIEEFDAFGRAIQNKKIVKNVFFSTIGKVKDREIVPQIADFCLLRQGIKLSVILGFLNGELIISMRNKDNRKDAGKILSKAFEDIGSAGGHKTMAAGVIKIEDLNKEDEEEIFTMIVDKISKKM